MVGQITILFHLAHIDHIILASLQHLVINGEYCMINRSIHDNGIGINGFAGSYSNSFPVPGTLNTDRCAVVQRLIPFSKVLPGLRIGTGNYVLAIACAIQAANAVILDFHYCTLMCRNILHIRRSRCKYTKLHQYNSHSQCGYCCKDAASLVFPHTLFPLFSVLN